MARVNVFLQEEILTAIDSEAAISKINRSALIQTALLDFLEMRRKAREETRLRRQREAASRDMDALAEKLGDWDAVSVIREQRDSRSRGVREPKKRYRVSRRKGQ